MEAGGGDFSGPAPGAWRAQARLSRATRSPRRGLWYQVEAA